MAGLNILDLNPRHFRPPSHPLVSPTPYTHVVHGLNWDEWRCSLDLASHSDREKLASQSSTSTSSFNGYQPGAFDKLGLVCRLVWCVWERVVG